MTPAERTLLYAVGLAVLAMLRGCPATDAARRHGERLDEALRAVEREGQLAAAQVRP